MQETFKINMKTKVLIR